MGSHKIGIKKSIYTNSMYTFRKSRRIAHILKPKSKNKNGKWKQKQTSTAMKPIMTSARCAGSCSLGSEFGNFYIKIFHEIERPFWASESNSSAFISTVTKWFGFAFDIYWWCFVWPMWSAYELPKKKIIIDSMASRKIRWVILCQSVENRVEYVHM